MARGKSIELFLANGTADSLITAEFSNWNGKAIKIPRIEVSECKRTDIKGAGVYYLFCKEEDDTDSVYIGEAENIQERLMQHLRDYAAEKETYYWNTVVLFVGRDLNKALIRYLESRLVDMARDSKRYLVLTKNTYRKTILKESQIAAMEEFLDNIKVLINTLGYKDLEPIVQKNEITRQEYPKLYLNIGSATATAMITSEGFVLLSGASVNERTAPRSFSSGLIKLRDKHYKAGRIKDWKTVEDILFSSSSTAACFVLGYNVSGPAVWKNEDGKTLKETEAEKSFE